MAPETTQSGCGRTAALFTFAAIAAVAVSANAATIETNGVSWAYTVNNETRRTVTWIQGSTPLAGTSTVDASLIPWTFVNPGDGMEYTVTSVAASAFSGVAWLVGQLTVPDAVTSIGASAFEGNSTSTLTGLVTFGTGITSLSNYALKNQRGITAVLFKGNVSSMGSQAVGYTSALKYVVFANPETKGYKGRFLTSDTNVKVFVPAAVTFHASDESDNMIIRYGSGQELDMLFGDAAVTVTPTTELSLTNAIAWASDPFAGVYGMDMMINITNRIETTMSITDEQLQDVTFKSPPWYLTFSVKTQAQLNNTLNAVVADIPIIADITGSTEEITVPEGRRVAILAAGGTTFNYRPRGLMITFR